MSSKTVTLKSDLLLLLTATIWGLAFVAQRAGMEYMGPFTFNGIRFALGSLSLWPLLMLNRKQRDVKNNVLPHSDAKSLLLEGIVAGTVLFCGASLQQLGLVYTTAGKAGFITGLYVVIVPVLSFLFWQQRPDFGTWIGASLAMIGLYFLSVTEEFTISSGDLIVLMSALFWAGHVLIIGWLSPKADPIELSSCQFAACSILSLITAGFFETITFQGVIRGAIPILYGGLMSVGVAYTLQVVAQQNAHPAHAAIILSTESVFAAVGGWIVLGEILSPRGFFGCALMLAGMLLSQLSIYIFHEKYRKLYNLKKAKERPRIPGSLPE